MRRFEDQQQRDLALQRNKIGHDELRERAATAFFEVLLYRHLARLGEPRTAWHAPRYVAAASLVNAPRTAEWLVAAGPSANSDECRISRSLCGQCT